MNYSGASPLLRHRPLNVRSPSANSSSSNVAPRLAPSPESDAPRPAAMREREQLFLSRRRANQRQPHRDGRPEARRLSHLVRGGHYASRNASTGVILDARSAADRRCGDDANAPRERERTRERHRRQQEPVDQHLPAHAPPAPSECEADRDLVASRERARQDQAREVGARDRQEDLHQRQQYPERFAVAVAQGRKARRERRDVHALAEHRLALSFRLPRRGQRRGEILDALSVRTLDDGGGQSEGNAIDAYRPRSAALRAARLTR
jgi:hypothetical protein